MKWIIIKLLTLYQRYISPLKGPSCRFYPTCSQYTLICVDRFGAVKGTFLGIKRLLKCHPFHKGGYDPPPEKPS